jgi:hypothetical protein
MKINMKYIDIIHKKTSQMRRLLKKFFKKKT